MNNLIRLAIQKPNDTSDSWSSIIQIVADSHADEEQRHVPSTCYYVRNAKDPVHAGLVSWWTDKITYTRRGYTSRGRMTNVKIPTYTLSIKVGTLPVIVSKHKNKYSINGKTERVSTIANVLARVTFKSIFDNNPLSLMKALTGFLSTPEEIKYCIENRVPYHFYDDFTKKDCRLNVQQISKDSCAIELSDGIWGTIKNKDLISFYTFYGLEKRRKSKWQFISPENLFSMTVGRTASDAELILMKEFLQQNRTQDIVDKRAIQLVNDLLEQHPSRLRAVFEEDELTSMFIKGKEYDWKLVSDPYKSNIQMVSTYVWQPSYSDSQFEKALEDYLVSNEDALIFNAENPDREIPLPTRPVNSYAWRGPICIDNMAPDSPIGDQFGARALALLNDTLTIKIVNTINRYLSGEPNINRVDLDEMQ